MQEILRTINYQSPNFESTNAPGLFLQDFLNFSVKKNDYKVLAIISDLNSSGDRPLKPINLNLADDENKIVLHPIVVKPEEFNCNEQNSFIMSNSGGGIPFSLEEFNLIIPVTDTSLTELELTLENNGEKISTITLNESYIEQFGISKCEDKILLTKSSENSPTRNFIIRDINKKLNEGDLTLTFRNEE